MRLLFVRAVRPCHPERCEAKSNCVAVPSLICNANGEGRISGEEAPSMS
ncbi:MAG: hypothetical protein IKM34_03655 [Clostridia bacterium]|nr:hypothetical protein [Clostridia bacterium]